MLGKKFLTNTTKEASKQILGKSIKLPKEEESKANYTGVGNE